MDEQPSVPTHCSGCCMCQPGKRPVRNLVVCIDGTSNQFGKKNTNVVELYSQLIKSDSQLTYYNSGVGTYAKPSWRSPSYVKQVLSNKVDLAIAWNFEKIVMSAYRWLVDNYHTGDRIYLFGFSRGAYQVRTIAGMIHKVGLIYKGNEEQIPFAYELYADPTSDSIIEQTSGSSHSLWPFSSKQKAETATPQKVDDTKKSSSERFKSTFSRKNVTVHFVGVWDTVSSIGFIRGKNLPGTVSPGHTRFFRHALALDERRVKFLPEYARGGVMVQEGSDEPQDTREQSTRKDVKVSTAEIVKGNTIEQATQPQPDEKIQGPHIKEVWFPGTHSDIGGGIKVNGNLDRRHPAFLWMAYEATSAQLLLNPSNVEWKWDELGAVHESLTGVWKVFEYLPFKRLSYKDANSHTWCWHRGRGRKIQPGQKVHASVAFCKRNVYHPKALLPGESGKSWSGLVGEGEKQGSGWTLGWITGWKDMLEMDIFDSSAAKTLFQERPKTENLTAWAHRLTAMTWSAEGRKTLKGIENAARRLVDMTHGRTDCEDVNVAIANAIMEISSNDPNLKVYICELRDRIDSKRSGTFLKKTICNARPSNRKFKAITTLLQGGMLSPEVDGSRTETNKSNEKPLDTQIIDTILEDLKSEDQSVRQSALDAMVGLARHDDLRCKMLDSDTDVVDKLLHPKRDEEQGVKAVPESTQHGDSHRKKSGSDTAQVLSKGDGESNEDFNQSAFDAIAELTKYDDLRRKMLHINVVALLKSLIEEHGKNYRPVLNVIRELAKYDDSRDKMLDSNIVTALFRKLGERNTDLYVAILQSITQLATGSHFPSKIFDANVEVTLLKRLRDKDQIVRQSALNAITQLVEHDDLRVKILNSNIVVGLLERLQDRHEDVREAALKTIAKLAEHSDSRANILSRSNIISALLPKRLGDDYSDVRQAAFDAVMELAKHDDSRHKMMNSEYLQVLSGKLGDEDDFVPGSALGVFTELAKHDDSRHKMMNSKYLQVLSRKLGDESSLIRLLALGVIIELANHDDSRSNMVDSDIVTAVLKSLEDGDNDVRQATLITFAKLAKYDDSRSNMLDSNSDIVGAILKMLGYESEDVCEAASYVITELEKHENSSRKILESDFVRIQSKNLRAESCDIRKSALRTITGLAKHDVFRRQMLNSVFVAALLERLGDTDGDVLVVALRVVMELAEHENSRTMILNSNIVASILPPVKHGIFFVQWIALNVVTELAKHDNSRRELLNSGIVEAVLEDLGDRHRLHHAALAVIKELAKHDDSRHKLGADAVSKLFTRLRDKDYNIRLSILDILTEFATHDDSCRQRLDSYSATHPTHNQPETDDSCRQRLDSYSATHPTHNQPETDDSCRQRLDSYSATHPTHNQPETDDSCRQRLDSYSATHPEAWVFQKVELSDSDSD